MPLFAAQATCTAPVGGSGKLKMNWFGATALRPEAGIPLMRRSDASTPETDSLKRTVIELRERTVPPGAGERLAIVGGVRSIRLYCQVDPAAFALNELGLAAWSAMPCEEFQLMRT